LRIVLVAAIAFAVVLDVPAFADDNEITCPENSVVRLYESATGMGSQTGTPTPEHPIEPVFYTQGDMVLRAVGDYKDSYDATTGKITRRVRVKVLNGEEGFVTSSYYLSQDNYQLSLSSLKTDSTTLMSSHFENKTMGSGTVKPYVGKSNSDNVIRFFIDKTDQNFSTLDNFKTWLADQARDGHPVVVYYPLAEETTEDWTDEHGTSYCADAIKIATKDYVTSSANADHGFGPLNTLLNTVITTINTLVVNTVNQAATIKDIATTRQTRPEVGCPAGKECLLIKNPDGTNNWFEIFDPFYEFFDPILSNIAATTYVDSQRRHFGDTDLCKMLSSCSQVAQTKITAIENPEYGALSLTQWGYEYKKEDIGGANWEAMNPNHSEGVVYGESKCVSIDVVSPAKYASKATAVQLNDPLWTARPTTSQEADKYRKCWCKATAIVYKDHLYKIPESSWVFDGQHSTATACAANCAACCSGACRGDVGVLPTFRAAMFDF